METLLYLHPAQLWKELQLFLEQGGSVLSILFITNTLLWLLICERLYYFNFIQKKQMRHIDQVWRLRKDKNSWYAVQIKARFISIFKIQTERSLSGIKLIILIAPLLGLLGTVVGMIEVFDVMASAGSSNARGMAGGVSKATIPTMAGMVISLCGLLFSVNFQRKSHFSVGALNNNLNTEESHV